HCDPIQPDASGRERVRVDASGPREWSVRLDPFSSYRAGFEVRTYRLCRRVLMFHHFPRELGTDDYLVRSLDLQYDERPAGSFITRFTDSSYERDSADRFWKASRPPLEFTYTQAEIDERTHEVDRDSLQNMPYGLDGRAYQWVDLDGEGVAGVLV